jgi:hypothetical protein
MRHEKAMEKIRAYGGIEAPVVYKAPPPPRKPGDPPLIPPVLVLPLPEALPPLSMVIYTLRYGGHDWITECGKTMDDWAARHDLPLRVWSHTGEYLPHPKFSVIEMIQDFIDGDFEWMMFFDADAYFHPLAPRPHFSEPGFWIMEDQPSRAPNHFIGWLRRNFEEKVGKWKYRNSGVWACDRGSAKKFMAEVGEPFISGWLEQHHFNHWLMEAERVGMAVRSLPAQWNRLPKDNGASWVFHLAGRRKMRDLADLRGLRFIPQRPERLEAEDWSHIPFAIAYPWRSNAETWDELRYSLRSIEANFADKTCPIFIFGDQAPEWLIPGGRVIFIEAWSYSDAIAKGVQCAAEVLWMNDDIAIMQPMSREDFVTPRNMGVMSRGTQENWMRSGNIWKMGMARAMVDLAHRGKPQMDCETHAPYLWERDKAMQVLITYGNWQKIPLQTLYVNHHGIETVALDGWRTSDPASGSPILNYVDHQIKTEFIEAFDGRFPNPAAWEKDARD